MIAFADWDHKPGDYLLQVVFQVLVLFFCLCDF